MKWTALLLSVALMSAALIGCENQESTTPSTPGAPSSPAPESPDAADPTAPAPSAPTTRPATQASASLDVANKYCAVMTDHEVDPKVTVAHAGKTIGFCCEDCISTFQKEPAKYLASMK